MVSVVYAVGTSACEAEGMGSTPIGHPWELTKGSHNQLHECAPGRAASLQNWRTGFDSSRSCLPTWLD